jgi:5-formyltetrahydrofolate cyclo-ligase
MSSKGTVRIAMRRLRQELAPADRTEWSRRITERLWTLEAFARAQRIVFYAATGDEVETLLLLHRWIEAGRKVILPRVAGDGMSVVEVDRLEDLAPGYRGILEPRPGSGRMVAWEEVEVALVPGLAFDVHGNRLGRGGGHYDRALARMDPKAVKIGLAFDFQVVERLPAEARDMPVDLVVTETRVIEAGGTKEGPMAGPLRR